MTLACAAQRRFHRDIYRGVDRASSAKGGCLDTKPARRYRKLQKKTIQTECGRAMNFSVEDLFSPVSVEEFLRDHWQRAPWRAPRDHNDAYDPLFTLPQLNDVVGIVARLSEASPEPTALIQLIGGEISSGRVTLRTGARSSRQIRDAYASGSSILIQAFHRFWAPLQRLCDNLERLLRSPVNTTFIDTPANSQAFGRHFDVADSLVLQLEGEKHWRVFESGSIDPLENVPRLPFEDTGEMIHRLRSVGRRLGKTDPKILFEGTLRPGDLLYIPRGIDHDVWTTRATSKHITIAVQPVTYTDALIAGIRSFADAERPARKRLDPEPWSASARTAMMTELRDLARRFGESFDAGCALAAIQEAFDSHILRRAPSLDDRASLDDDAVGLNWVLEHVSDLRGSISLEGKSAQLSYGERRFLVPLVAAEALTYISSRARFAIRDLPGLSDDGRLVLCRRLLRAHVLRKVSDTVGNKP